MSQPWELIVRYIPVDDILPNPSQPRKVITPEELSELAGDIKERGLQHPIRVQKTEESWMIVTGSRRLAAARQLGWQKIPCVVKPTSNEIETILTALSENIQRQDLSDYEIAQALDNLRKTMGLGTNELARQIHKSPSYVSQHLKVFSEPDIVDALKKGEISYPKARELAYPTVKNMVKGNEEENSPKKISSPNVTSSKRPSLEELLPIPEEHDELAEVIDELRAYAISLRILIMEENKDMDEKLWEELREVGHIIDRCLTEHNERVKYHK
jgi:ParB/RepB/Spo0J family partition protein